MIGKIIIKLIGIGMTLETAEIVFSWGNRLLLISLLLGVAATYGIVISADVKEDALKLEVARAGRDAGIANRAAADANSKSVMLEVKIAPREIHDVDTAIEELEPNAGKSVRVSSYALDVESARLGRQVLDILHRSSISTDNALLSKSALGDLYDGISVTGSDPKLVDALLKVFNIEKIEASTIPPMQTAGMELVENKAPADATVFVGVKPIPK